jgi:hypothetical protein
MQYKTFYISAKGDSASEEEMNRFLRANRILNVQRELVHLPDGAAWCFCAEYLETAIGGIAPPLNTEAVWGWCLKIGNNPNG